MCPDCHSRRVATAYASGNRCQETGYCDDGIRLTCLACGAVFDDSEPVLAEPQPAEVRISAAA